jgi:hypothetical protein
VFGHQGANRKDEIKIKRKDCMDAKKVFTVAKLALLVPAEFWTLASTASPPLPPLPKLSFWKFPEASLTKMKNVECQNYFVTKDKKSNIHP